MNPQNLMDAFKLRYLVWVQNSEEKMALLGACHDLGIKWRDDTDALNWIPRENQIYLEYDTFTGKVAYGFSNHGNKEIEWADLRMERGHSPLISSFKY